MVLDVRKPSVSVTRPVSRLAAMGAVRVSPHTCMIACQHRGSCGGLRVDQVQFPERFGGAVVVNDDIGSTVSIQGFANAFQIRTVNADDQVELALRPGLDVLTAGQVPE